MLALAGIGGVVNSAAHASSPPTAIVQQQVGSQTTGPESAVSAPEASSDSSAPEAAVEPTEAAETDSTDADGPGGPDVQNGPND